MEDNGRHATQRNGWAWCALNSLNRNGEISLLQATAALPGAGPVDMSVVGDTLYLERRAHTTTTATVSSNGELTAGQSVTLPVSVVGLAAI